VDKHGPHFSFCYFNTVVLTYMSLEDHLSMLCETKRLWLLTPTDEGKKLLRCVYVTNEVKMFLEGAKGIPKDLLPVAGGALAAFDTYMGGGRVTFGMDPHQKDRAAMMARNAPPADGICDVRVLDPKPQVRIFGAFPAQDIFVAMTWHRRRLLAFAGAVGRAKKQWLHLFADMSPVVSEKVTDYVSAPVDPV